VRYILENDDGDEIKFNLSQNTSGVSLRGHSYNAASRRLEARLGDVRLYGGDSVVVEFDVTINANTTEVQQLINVTANRVSKNSQYNNITASALYTE
jgi:hypothetical protein